MATSSSATLTATLAGLSLIAGTQYAVAFGRPGSNNADANTRKGDGSARSGRLFIADRAGVFKVAFAQDSLVSVLVIEGHPATSHHDGPPGAQQRVGHPPHPLPSAAASRYAPPEPGTTVQHHPLPAPAMVATVAKFGTFAIVPVAVRRLARVARG